MAVNLEPSATVAGKFAFMASIRHLHSLFNALGSASPSLWGRLELVLHLAALAFKGEAGLGLAVPVVSFFPDGCH